MLFTLIAASIAYSTPTQTLQAAAKEKTATTAEAPPAIDFSKVPLLEGTHEIYRDAKRGLRVSRIVRDGKILGHFAVDKKGNLYVPLFGCNTVCFGSGANSSCMLRFNYCY